LFFAKFVSMKIYTKTGDKGETSLFGGSRVSKDNIRIESYGTVDELNSYLGLIRDYNLNEEDEKVIIGIQDRLFTLGSLLAADPSKNNLKLPPLKQEDVELLELEMDKMNEILPEMKTFVLPGGDKAASHCHIARCICRRAERSVITLAKQESIDEILIQYLNRLSDYLFVLARKQMQLNKGKEVPWIPKM
jgi:cob(I)alamin adenosyltransferase